MIIIIINLREIKRIYIYIYIGYTLAVRLS